VGLRTWKTEGFKVPSRAATPKEEEESRRVIFSHLEKADAIMPKPCSIVFCSDSRTFYRGGVIPCFPRSGFVYLMIAAE
jgi:hypothetical protein